MYPGKPQVRPAIQEAQNRTSQEMVLSRQPGIVEEKGIAGANIFLFLLPQRWAFWRL